MYFSIILACFNAKFSKLKACKICMGFPFWVGILFINTCNFQDFWSCPLIWQTTNNIPGTKICTWILYYHVYEQNVEEIARDLKLWNLHMYLSVQFNEYNDTCSKGESSNSLGTRLEFEEGKNLYNGLTTPVLS